MCDAPPYEPFVHLCRLPSGNIKVCFATCINDKEELIYDGTEATADVNFNLVGGSGPTGTHWVYLCSPDEIVVGDRPVYITIIIKKDGNIVGRYTNSSDRAEPCNA